jgi:formamidopyrimidine-DNA glycosylase
MDQHVIAGLGNVYVDEILFQADVNPMASLTSLTATTRGRLFQIMRRVLRRAIAVGAEPQRLPRTYQLPHRRKAGNCPRCGSEWSTMIIGGRTTYYCRRHQKR